MNHQNKTELVEFTSDIVAAYIANNAVTIELPNLIISVHAALGSLGKQEASLSQAEPPKPAVPIEKSIMDDYLISLFDGRKFKSLKRHLMAKHNINSDEYRTMFGLPKDYPMVAPAYAK